MNISITSYDNDKYINLIIEGNIHRLEIEDAEFIVEKLYEEIQYKNNLPNKIGGILG